MIVPRNRLLFLTGALVVPLSVLGSIMPGWGGGSAAALALFIAAASADALFAHRGLRGIRIDLPELVRLTHGR
ncbi:MAG TPA: hypothetical protein VFA47_09105, partial [Candidatus Manganitrophaceae bacterium]|nr:hypothetical protein [Candidatus Manganitrophaceae bacterium]